MGIPTFGGNNGSNKARRNGGICPLQSEHHITVDYDMTNNRAVSGGGEDSESMVDLSVIGTEGS